MSSPEFQLSPFVVKSNVYPHDLVDEIENVLARTQGKHTAQNVPGDLCGGKIDIGACATSRQLMTEMVDTVRANRLGGPEQNNKYTRQADCDECGMSCSASARIINGMPSGRIRFVFEEHEVLDNSSEVITSQQPVIPTSFDGTYFRLPNSGHTIELE